MQAARGLPPPPPDLVGAGAEANEAEVPARRLRMASAVASPPPSRGPVAEQGGRRPRGCAGGAAPPRRCLLALPLPRAATTERSFGCWWRSSRPLVEAASPHHRSIRESLELLELRCTPTRPRPPTLPSSRSREPTVRVDARGDAASRWNARSPPLPPLFSLFSAEANFGRCRSSKLLELV
jgi:hypothetical protein